MSEDLDRLDRLAAEKWAPIPRFVGYEASDQGRIRCNIGRRKQWRVLKQNLAGRYFQVYPETDGRKRVLLVHRAVLSAFRGSPKEGQICCHSDGNAKNNNLSNLRWDSHKANIADKWKHGTMPVGEETNSAKLTAYQVQVIRRMNKESGVGPRALAKIFCVDRTTIQRILRRKTWRHL